MRTATTAPADLSLVPAHLALDLFAFGCVFPMHGRELESQFLREAGEAAFPTFAPADDGGVDKHALPGGRGRDVDRFFLLESDRFGSHGNARKARQQFVIRWEIRFWRLTVVLGGCLTERQIFRETSRRTSFRGTG